jgi:hypothetical protein
MASRDYLKHVVSTSEAVGSGLGDEYYNPSTNQLFKRLAVNGTSVQWVAQVRIEVVTALPSSPVANTLYIVTG